MSLGLLVAVITVFVFPFLDAFVPVLCVAVLLNTFVAPVTPLADSATMYMLADEKEMYSRVRLGGTLGYGIAALISGLVVQKHGLRVAFLGCAALFFLGFIVSQRLVFGRSDGDRPASGRVWTLLTSPRWVLFLVVAFAGGAGMAVFNNYLFPYMKELGADESMMGLALLVGTFSEIPTLFFGNRLIQRLRPYGLLMVSMVVTGLRMLLFAASGTPILVLFIQLLNGLTLPAMWVAGVSYADEHAPPGMRTTAQGLFGAMVMGFGTAVGGFVGGPLLGSIGGRGLYLVFGVSVLAIVAIVALIYGRLPPEREETVNAAIE
jgi:PPP family 3-phenylpropionic acid transporter